MLEWKIYARKLTHRFRGNLVDKVRNDVEKRSRKIEFLKKYFGRISINGNSRLIIKLCKLETDYKKSGDEHAMFICEYCRNEYKNKNI